MSEDTKPTIYEPTVSATLAASSSVSPATEELKALLTAKKKAMLTSVPLPIPEGDPIAALLRFPNWTPGEVWERTMERTVALVKALEFARATKAPLPHWRGLCVISGDLAEAWLLDNFGENYRALESRDAHTWAKKMETGLIPPDDTSDNRANDRWVEGHIHGIAFSRKAALGDGQHRVSAVAIFASRTGKSVRMNVDIGLTKAELDAIDRGKPRTAAHDLAFDGFFKDEKELATVQRALDVANKMRVGFNVQKSNKNAANPVALAHADELVSVIHTLLRADNIIIDEEGKRKKKNKAVLMPKLQTDVAAALCKAALGEWPMEAVLTAAGRFAKQDWITGRDDDPLRLLDARITAKASPKPGRRLSIYRLAVAAIRAELQGHGLDALNPANYDFVAPWEPGYIPLAGHEVRRKAHKTVLARYAGTGMEGRINEAIDALAHARSLGMVSAIVGEGEKRKITHEIPVNFPDRVGRRIHKYKEEIKELVIEETQPTSSATSATVPVSIGGEIVATKDAGAKLPSPVAAV